jgi:hypothetical protein
MLSELMYFLGRVKITYNKKPFLDTNIFLFFYVQNNSNLIINSHNIYKIHKNPLKMVESSQKYTINQKWLQNIFFCFTYFN